MVLTHTLSPAAYLQWRRLLLATLIMRSVARLHILPHLLPDSYMRAQVSFALPPCDNIYWEAWVSEMPPNFSSNLGDFGSRRARVLTVSTSRTAVVRRSFLVKSAVLFAQFFALSTSLGLSLSNAVSLGFKLVETVEKFAEVSRRGDAHRDKQSAPKAEEFRSRSRLVEPL